MRRHTDFGQQQWQVVAQRYRDFWNGDLDRPIIHATLSGYEPDRQRPSRPRNGDYLGHYLGYDRAVPARDILDWQDYGLSQTRYLGDAFPMIPFKTPRAAAPMMGAELRQEGNTIWSEPPEQLPVEELRLRIDPDNKYWRRTQEMYEAAVDYWKGEVLLNMPTLGANLDIVVPFVGNQGLLLQFYDNPGQVERLIHEAHHCWWHIFDRIVEIVKETNPGYSCWSDILSDSPCYILQCDFAAMIGPDMFDEFVLPELDMTAKRLGKAYFHLDGPGLVPHLDSIMSIPEIKGVQWVPGPKIAADGDFSMNVYRKIKRAGKFVEVTGSMAAFDRIVKELGSAEGLFLRIRGCRENEAEVLRFLEEYAQPSHKTAAVAVHASACPSPASGATGSTPPPMTAP
jgi:hypothetical protein